MHASSLAFAVSGQWTTDGPDSALLLEHAKEIAQPCGLDGIARFVTDLLEVRIGDRSAPELLFPWVIRRGTHRLGKSTYKLARSSAPTGTISGYAADAFTRTTNPEFDTTTAHLREVLGDQIYESVARKGRDDDHRRRVEIRIRPNRPGPNRTERGLELDEGNENVLCQLNEYMADKVIPEVTRRLSEVEE